MYTVIMCVLPLTLHLQDPRQIEGKIISAEEDANGEIRYYVLFPGNEQLSLTYASDLTLCDSTRYTILSRSKFLKLCSRLGILQFHPYQQEELNEKEIQKILNVLVLCLYHR